MTSVTIILKAMLLMAGLAFASLASAEEIIPDIGGSNTPNGVEAISADELGELFGGDGAEAVIITEETLTAINHGNSVSGDVVGSGDISLSAGALASFDGIGNFVMNTGHNNNLQSSMSVSVMLGPGP